MRRLLFVGLGHLSKGDVSIAADFARQLPRPPFRIAFVSVASTRTHLQALGLPTVALEEPSPADNLARFDELVRTFRPDALIAGDAYTLDYSVDWSGLSMGLLRERYGLPLLSFDQYEWKSADYVVDFYGDIRLRFPRLLDDCDLVIRNCPLNKARASEPGVAVAPFSGDGPHVAKTPPTRRPAPKGRERTIFLASSKWELVNVVKSPHLDRMIEAMPRIVHHYLAELDAPLDIVHVGPAPWQFPVADGLRYRHFSKLPPHLFHEKLCAADLFITPNVASVTLSQAVLAGVPSLLLQNHKVLDLRTLRGTAVEAVQWLEKLIPEVDVVYPFRVFPWGWHDFLTPVLHGNDYTATFTSVPLFERYKVGAALEGLLYDPARITDVRDRQHTYREALRTMPSPAEALEEAAARPVGVRP